MASVIIEGAVFHQRWKEIEALYQEALEVPDPTSFLTTACRGDTDLFENVNLLLRQPPSTIALFDRLAWLDSTGPSSSPDRALLPAGSSLGPYLISRQLGSGGSSDVYLAFDARLDREVALKVFAQSALPEEHRVRVVREAKAAAALNHPNIASIYEVGELDGLLFIAMEFVEGVTLREKLGERSRTLPETLGYFRQVASALARAHSKGIVHCDLKPDNIMVTHDGLVKVLDFGLVRLVEGYRREPAATPHAASATTTRPVRVRIEGTIGYMSPEQAAGEPLDARSDVFSFGCMLFEAISGKLPFWHASIVQSLHNLVHEAAPPLAGPSNVPVALRQLVDACLTRDPALRPASMDEVSRRLQSIAQARPATPKRWIWGAVAVMVLALAGASLWPGRGTADVAIAVIPFVSTGSAAEGAFLAEGISEGLIIALAQLPDLKVISRNSSFRFTGPSLDVPNVARTLGVRALVTGRIVELDGRLRVSAELVSEDGTAIWGAEYTPSLTNLADVQAHIATDVAKQVRSGLTDADQRKLTRPIHPNSDVYALLLRGRYQMWLYSPESTQKAATYFEQALGIDPGYAVANAELANAYRRLAGAGIMQPAEAIPLAEQAASRAIAADDESVEAHSVLADIRRDQWDWETAEREYRRAISLSPSFVPARQGLAIGLSERGQDEAAVAEIAKVRELDPVGMSSAIDSAAVFYNLRRYDQALQILRETLSRDGLAPAIWTWIGIVSGGAGRLDESITAFEKAMQLGDRTPATLCYYVHVLARLGRRDEAMRSMQTVERATFVPPSSLAIAYVGLGENGRALEQLEKALAARDPLLQYIPVESFLNPLKNDARFHAVVAGMKPLPR